LVCGDRGAGTTPGSAISANLNFIPVASVT
jgi:hypothetical protein